MKQVREKDVVLCANDYEKQIVDIVLKNMSPGCWGDFPVEVVVCEKTEKSRDPKVRNVSFEKFMYYFLDDTSGILTIMREDTI